LGCGKKGNTKAMIEDYINPHGKPSKQFNSIEFLLEQVVMGTYEYGEDKILCKTLPKSMIEHAKEMHKQEIVKAAARGYLAMGEKFDLNDAYTFANEYFNNTFK
jgi:hypothetical protein